MKVLLKELFFFYTKTVRTFTLFFRDAEGIVKNIGLHFNSAEKDHLRVSQKMTKKKSARN